MARKHAVNDKLYICQYYVIIYMSFSLTYSLCITQHFLSTVLVFFRLFAKKMEIYAIIIDHFSHFSCLIKIKYIFIFIEYGTVSFLAHLFIEKIMPFQFLMLFSTYLPFFFF